MWERADPSIHLQEGSLGAEVMSSLNSPYHLLQSGKLASGPESRRAGPAPLGLQHLREFYASPTLAPLCITEELPLEAWVQGSQAEGMRAGELACHLLMATLGWPSQSSTGELPLVV